jgi:hypothetical protein
LEAAARNCEAIAASNRNASDEDIAAAVESEFTDTDVLTVSVSGATVTVTQTSGSITAFGSVLCSAGVATITDATTGGSTGGSSSSTSTTSTTVATISYSVGDTGPGGGIVFYVASTPFACGPTLAAACTYLEAAPAEISGKPTWCSSVDTLLNVGATAIGTGMANTTTASATCTSGAIQQAADYSNGGFSDWFLPSKDEMTQLYLQKSTVGGFASDFYWSSSEDGQYGAWAQHSGVTNPYSFNKSQNARVRPVRAF